jgi:pyruvate dehydrogenase E1 component alpha subunit
MPKDIAPQVLVDLCRTMLLIRRFEEKIIEVYGRQDMKTPVHLYIGQEAIAAGVCGHLSKEDYIFTTHRSHGHCLAKGMDPRKLYAEFYGRIDGCCRGRGGSMHPADASLGILGTTAIVGGCVPLAVGTALASAMRKDGRVSVVFFGDGACDEGSFQEGLNFAALKKLPVLFVCENNFWAVGSPQSARHAHGDIYKRAEGFAMPGVLADGNDVLAVYRTAGQAVERARSGGGPTLIEARTYRWKGHVGPEADWQLGTRPRQELEDWIANCPLKSYSQRLIESGAVEQSEYMEMIQQIDKMLDEAMAFAKASPFPSPRDLLADVYR